MAEVCDLAGQGPSIAPASTPDLCLQDHRRGARELEMENDKVILSRFLDSGFNFNLIIEPNF